MSIERVSRIGLPMSSVSSNASSSRSRSISSASRNMIFFFSRGVLLRQRPSSNATRAALTAASMSSTSHEATWFSALPSRGPTFSNVLPLLAPTSLPSITACVGNFTVAARSRFFCRLMGGV
jgi:hypothetical protein